MSHFAEDQVRVEDHGNSVKYSVSEGSIHCERLARWDIFCGTSHKIQIAGNIVDVDIMIREANLVVEFDGSYWHQEKQDADRLKTERLVQAGWRVVRAREEPLQPVSQYCVLVSQKNRKEVANRVLLKIGEVLGIEIDGLHSYLKRVSLLNADMANRRIEAMLCEQSRPEGLDRQLFFQFDEIED